MNGGRPVPPGFEAILNRGRMLADGIPFADLREAEDVARAGDEVQWFDFWLDKSRSYEDLATTALAAGDSISGGEWMWHASLSAHYAQFMWFHEPERREAGQRRKVELYDRAAPHFRRPGERIEVPFQTTRIPAYLRLPHEAAQGPVACCVLIGGLESTKEESHLFENLLLERGLATVTFDGPGQGELFFEVKLGTDFDRCTSAIVDEVERRPEIDARRIGVLGRSLGGHYAPLSAARDKRFAACCAWGACFDLADLDSMPAHTRAGFVYVTGIDDERAALAHLRASINLAGVAGEIRCPTLVLHGRHDVIFGIDQVEKFRAEVTEAELEVQVEDDGDHCCHNMGHLVRPRMADWMASRLGAAG